MGKKDVDLKMSLEVKLLSNHMVRFKLIYVAEEITNFPNYILHTDEWGYQLVKNAFNFQYYKNRFVMPGFIYNDNNYICQYLFHNEKDRRSSLKKLSNMLENFSKSEIFKNREYGFNFYKNKLVYTSDYWFLY